MLSMLIGSSVVMASPVEVTEPSCEQKMELTVTETKSFLLPGNPTTGFIWQVAECADVVEVKVEIQPKQAPRGMVGCPRNTEVSVTGKQAGQGTVKLIYARPWEKGKAPLHTHTVKVNVK